MRNPSFHEERIARLLGRDHARPLSEMQLAFAGVILHGHFRLHGDRHSRKYVRIPADFYETDQGSFALAQLLSQLSEAGVLKAAQAFVGPETGGARIARVMANVCGIPWIAVKKDPWAEFGYRITQQEAEFLECKKIIAVDDVLDTGNTLSLVLIPLLTQVGAHVMASGVIAERGAVQALPHCRFESYWKLQSDEHFPADDCPMCQACEPITQF